jgi:hypothetical protein
MVVVVPCCTFAFSKASLTIVYSYAKGYVRLMVSAADKLVDVVLL